MANVTDPLIRALQGSDPQNLMEYITRQKIYDSRFWKEECFGLAVVDVLEKAARLKCVGGTMGANQQPTQFLCLTLKLLQLQPESELIEEEFIQQDHFKYVRVLGAFYLRLTGRPADIYRALEPLYQDFSKLKLRERNEWRLTYVDQVIHELLTDSYFCGITLPRLPARETLQQEGYLEEGPRPTALQDAIAKAGGLEEFLNYKAHVQKSPAAIELWKERTMKDDSSDDKKKKKAKGSLEASSDSPAVPLSSSNPESLQEEEEGELERPMLGGNKKRTGDNGSEDDNAPKKKKRKKSKDDKYGTLFKKSSGSSNKRGKDAGPTIRSSDDKAAPEEGSEEYWNEQRAKLGLKPLSKK